MRSIRNLFVVGAIAVSTLALSAQAYAADIVDTAVAAGSFNARSSGSALSDRRQPHAWRRASPFF
jgi:hypothetical protein